MDDKSAYEQLMRAINGPKSIAEDQSESKARKVEYNSEFQAHHKSQTELVSWLQQYRSQNGIAGKRKPLERENLDQPLAENTSNQRRRVVVRPRKLIDE